MKKNRDNSMLVVAVDVTRPLDGLWPNRLYTSSPMVWGRCRYSYIGCPHTMDNNIFKSRWPPWCGNFVFWCCNKLRKRPRKSIVEVRYYSTEWTPFELRRCKTRVKLVPRGHRLITHGHAAWASERLHHGEACYMSVKVLYLQTYYSYVEFLSSF